MCVLEFRPAAVRMSAAQNLSISLTRRSGTRLLLSGTAVTVGSLSNWPAAENTVEFVLFVIFDRYW